MPLNLTFDINFTLPSIYLTEETNIPTNYMQTYDQIDAIISSPRTGDLRTSLNSFAPFGWVAANDGTIGTKASNATSRANADTWPLYNLIWNAVSNTYAPLQNSAGTPIARGGSAYADFTANNRLSLTKALGRSLCSAGSGSGLTSRQLGEVVGTGNGTVTLTTNEMPNHSHPGSTVGLGFDNTGSVVPASAGVYVSAGPTAVSVAAQGNGAAFSIMNPSVYYNVFFKL